MRASDQKFLDILVRHGLPVEDLESMSVAMNRRTFGGRSRVIFYGVGQPIPPEIAKAIATEVFPLIAAEKTDFGAENDGAVISDQVLPLGDPAVQAKGFDQHCQLCDIGE